MDLQDRLNIYLKSSLEKERCPQLNPIPRIGYIRQTPCGDTWIVDWSYEAGSLHGGYRLEKSASAIPGLIDPLLNGLNPSLASVIDTETTGLAGGTGTYAFIIGCGFWRGDNFIIRQYIMRDFNEEPAQLCAFASDITRSLITYNGKCFDMPLLTNRFRLHRFEPPFNSKPHLDMLPPCRRIWKRHLTSFKLSAIELNILGYARQDDIPSYMIPSIFFDYLQNRDETVLYPILNHNRDDVLSLYVLTAIAGSLIENCFINGGNDDDLLLSLTEICFNYGKYDQAIELAEKIKPDFASEETSKKTLLLKALAYKKLGDWQNALQAFDGINGLKPEIFSLIEQAKLHEHKYRDFRRALEAVAKAEKLIEFGIYAGEGASSELAAIMHRKKRLLYRLSRTLQS
jgi:hypothetical protein